MADLGEGFAGKFIFIITLLGVFIFIVSVMTIESPALFVDADTDYDSYLPPDYLTNKMSAEELRTLVFWGNATSNASSTSVLTIDRGDLDDIDIEITWQVLSGNFDQWIMRKHWYDWGFWRKNEDVLPKFPLNERSSPQWLCEDDVFSARNLDDTNNFSRILMYDNAFNYVTFMTYDEGRFASLQDAVSTGDVIISIGMGWEYESSVLSGWDLIARLLVFQAPNIHPYVNAIIAIPLWACISILIFGVAISIVKALPFT